jgi:20S proteasome subunit alpha 6
MSPHDLATPQEKVFEIDNHMGIVISGMTADARYLCKFLRNECLSYWYTHESQHPCERIVTKIARKAQVKTCSGSKRPFGVGVLLGAHDEAGTHLFETCPSGNYYEFYAMAIGDRCQSAKTYLEKNFNSFEDASVHDLVAHGLKALRNSAQDTELTENNVSVGIVGVNEKFHLLSKEELKARLAEGADDEEMK